MLDRIRRANKINLGKEKRSLYLQKKNFQQKKEFNLQKKKIISALKLNFLVEIQGLKSLSNTVLPVTSHLHPFKKCQAKKLAKKNLMNFKNQLYTRFTPICTTKRKIIVK